MNMHFAVKTRTGQTSVGGELEAAACVIPALETPMRIHTDCEWVEKGIKEILNAIAKGETPSKREHSKVWTLTERKSGPSRQDGWRWSTFLDVPRKRW